ncbi:hypothetical protein OPV22_027522 [Ensete ventricosum]|uniref:Dof-type domain-containing protein n=1 Tax=Ensete ventricosum TaxID=4639 RepID=A0AAV8PSA3_ENSVE|nr:hypothetical protein OPV22_027522 [Ensete ventricosum]
MSDAKDPAIMLFGNTIPVATDAPAAADGKEAEAEVEEADAEPVVFRVEGQEDASKEVTNVEVNDISAAAPAEENEGAPISSSGLTSSNEEDGKTSIADEKKAVKNTVEDTRTEADCSGPEKVLKKPDKILPCPRCNSMDTKFCYYNNYNVSQPRHFCKNCQRYWTAGGTMRNVPVGAGRRKSKHLASQGHNLVTPSNGLQSAQPDTLDLTHQQPLPCVPVTPSQPLIGNGTIHKFGQEVPLCEPMASVLNIREQGGHADSGSTICQESREEPSGAASAAASNILENGSAENAIHKELSDMRVYRNGLAPLTHLHCYPGASWSYPWRPAWNNVAAMEAGRCSSENPCRPGNGYSNPIPLSPSTMMAATLPFFLMPTPFWGFTTWSNGMWNIPLVGSNSGFISSSSSSSSSCCSGNDSRMLGKHPRDATSQSEEKMEKSLWVPKTLRIDDPEEAAKSSIWAALGIKPGIGGIFQSKADNKAHKSDVAHVLHANPAALSRSLSFQENT